MATSEPLVPKGLPKGSRAQVRDGMQRAGIPLAPSARTAGQSGSILPSPSGTNPPAEPRVGLDLSQHSPDEFPFLQDQAPEPASPQAPASVTSAFEGSAQSEFARAVMQRITTRGGAQ